MFRRIGRHLGRRGSALLILGAVWCSLGLGLLVNTRNQPRSAMLIDEWIPTWLRVAVWCGTGLVAMGFAWARRPGWDTWGFAALVVLPLMRTVGYTAGWAWWVGQGPERGYPAGLSLAVVWGGMTALVLLIAGWPESDWITGKRGQGGD